MTRPVPLCGLALIKNVEGLELKTYPDEEGNPTNGYGHTGPDVFWGQTITLATAEANLVKDTASAWAAICRLVKVQLTDNQAGALLSFVFNEGAGAFADSTLLRLLNAGRYTDVPAQLQRWVYITLKDGSKRKSNGLIRRRNSEIALWNSATT